MKFSAQSVKFVPLPAWIYGRSTADEKAVLGALQYHFPNIEPSLERITELSGVSRSSVLRVIRSLEEKGWITVARTAKEKGKKTRNRYALNIFDHTFSEVRGVRVEPLTELEVSGWNVCRGVTVERLTDLEVSGWNVQKCQNTEFRGVRVTPKLNKAKLNQEETALNRSQRLSGKVFTFEEPPLGPPMGGSDQFPDPWEDEFLGEPRGEATKQVQPQPVVIDQGDATAAAMTQQATPPATMAGDTSDEATASKMIAPCSDVKKRKPRFSASAALIPDELRAVEVELLKFWQSKGGEKSEGAWKRVISGAMAIQSDPRGGAEILRSQLTQGAEEGWRGISRANWEKYGQKAKTKPIAGTGLSGDQAPWMKRNLRGYDLVAAAEALGRARDEQNGQRYQEAPQQASEAILEASERVLEAELVA